MLEVFLVGSWVFLLSEWLMLTLIMVFHSWATFALLSTLFFCHGMKRNPCSLFSDFGLMCCISFADVTWLASVYRGAMGRT